MPDKIETDDFNVEEIVIDWLKSKGYDGLRGDDCGCFLDDLMPCEDSFDDCHPGFECDMMIDGNGKLSPAIGPRKEESPDA